MDRDALDALSNASDQAVRLAIRDLGAFFDAAASWPPERVRDGLIQVMRALVDEYGDMAASAAAQWYEQARAEQIAGPYRAVLADRVPPAQVEGVVRSAAGGLFTGETARVAGAMESALQRLIKGQERATITANALHDPAAKRFARVPRGKTCAFCLMLASRGFVYTSAKAAGELNRYHDKCDCQIVPSFGHSDPVIEGYDPEVLKKDYEAARNAAIKAGIRNPDAHAITAQMRVLKGDAVKDGKGVKRDAIKPRKRKRKVSKDGTLQATKVAEFHADAVRKLAELPSREPGRVYKIAPDRTIEAPKNWPDDLPPLRAKEWYHTLYGDEKTGGHLYGYGWRTGGTEFPQDWTPDDIARAAIQLLRSHGVEEAVTRSFVGVMNGVEIKIAYRNDEKMRRIKSIYPLKPERNDVP